MMNDERDPRDEAAEPAAERPSDDPEPGADHAAGRSIRRLASRRSMSAQGDATADRCRRRQRVIGGSPSADSRARPPMRPAASSSPRTRSPTDRAGRPGWRGSEEPPGTEASGLSRAEHAGRGAGAREADARPLRRGRSRRGRPTSAPAETPADVERRFLLPVPAVPIRAMADRAARRRIRRCRCAGRPEPRNDKTSRRGAARPTAVRGGGIRAAARAAARDAGR